MALNHLLQSNLDTHRFIKYIFLIFASLILLFSFVGGAHAANGAFGGGEGTQLNPFIIEDAADLTAINSHLGSCFILGQNITLTGEWTPIGSLANPFTGRLDGNGKTISNLTINSTSPYVGLFSCTSGASITNLTLESAVVQSTASNSGALAGQANNTIFDNITITGDIKGNSQVGGLAGFVVSNSTISNSFAAGNVSGNGTVGGFVGDVYSSTISNSSAVGNVSGAGSTGGFVGYAFEPTISNSFFIGNVSGSELVGGFIGETYLLNISNSFAAGNVSGNELVGGFAGKVSFYSTISNSFTIGNVSGNSSVGGFIGQMDRTEISNIMILNNFVNGT
ncbi:MAG: hypothetical protein LBE57_07140, partial [Methanosarcinales archaeon]|nr:hypothetical protein [Methanosarcinales archaeon]